RARRLPGFHEAPGSDRRSQTITTRVNCPAVGKQRQEGTERALTVDCPRWTRRPVSAQKAWSPSTRGSLAATTPDGASMLRKASAYLCRGLSAYGTTGT